jgi:predicted protein tyrosine phosphatase
MSFRQLINALALARHHNFRLTAAQLHSSQPALNRSIMALDETMPTLRKGGLGRAFAVSISTCIKELITYNP